MRWRKNLANMVLQMLPEDWQSKKLLDLGCGDGFTIRLIKQDGDVSGIDIDPIAVNRARARGIEGRIGSASSIPFPNESFDIVTSIEVLEHLEDPLSAVKEARRVLKPGGSLIVTTPIPSIPWNTIWKIWSTIGPGKVWSHTPHVQSFNVWNDSGSDLGLVSILSRKGFVIKSVSRCNYGMIVGIRAERV
jgi:2-polyprenyl-6-hydroxyphenyl methylase/3-demethylubiquinone-9 3-methyltransferase